MALSQSALSELAEVFRTGEGTDFIRECVRVAMQELIDTEAATAIGAGRYERTESRTTERNGSRPRLLTTHAGDVQLAIPKLRAGSFFPSILSPRRRIDQALYAVVMEAYVHGVSTRSVDDLVTALGDGDLQEEVSRICAGLDESVGAFRTRRLDHVDFPGTSTRRTCMCAPSTAWSCPAVVVATGVTAHGRREILGLDVGDSEDEVFWRAFLTGLKKRGLTGVQLVISDQHAGLVAAIARAMQGAAHHAAASTSSATSWPMWPRARPRWSPPVRTIFPLPGLDGKQWDKVAAELAAVTPIGALMDAAKAEVWRSRRSRASTGANLVHQPARATQQGDSHRAVLADTHDEWATDERRYLSEESSQIGKTDDTDPVALTEG